MSIILISGNFKDDSSEFERLKVETRDEITDDTSIFMYGVSLQELRSCFDAKHKTGYDFILTSIEYHLYRVFVKDCKVYLEVVYIQETDNGTIKTIHGNMYFYDSNSEKFIKDREIKNINKHVLPLYRLIDSATVYEDVLNNISKVKDFLFNDLIDQTQDLKQQLNKVENHITLIDSMSRVNKTSFGNVVLDYL